MADGGVTEFRLNLDASDVTEEITQIGSASDRIMSKLRADLGELEGQGLPRAEARKQAAALTGAAAGEVSGIVGAANVHGAGLTSEERKRLAGNAARAVYGDFDFGKMRGVSSEEYKRAFDNKAKSMQRALLASLDRIPTNVVEANLQGLAVRNRLTGAAPQDQDREIAQLRERLEAARAAGNVTSAQTSRIYERATLAREAGNLYYPVDYDRIDAKARTQARATVGPDGMPHGEILFQATEEAVGRIAGLLTGLSREIEAVRIDAERRATGQPTAEEVSGRFRGHETVRQTNEEAAKNETLTGELKTRYADSLRRLALSQNQLAEMLDLVKRDQLKSLTDPQIKARAAALAAKQEAAARTAVEAEQQRRAEYGPANSTRVRAEGEAARRTGRTAVSAEATGLEAADAASVEASRRLDREKDRKATAVNESRAADDVEARATRLLSDEQFKVAARLEKLGRQTDELDAQQARLTQETAEAAARTAVEAEGLRTPGQTAVEADAKRATETGRAQVTAAAAAGATEADVAATRAATREKRKLAARTLESETAEDLAAEATHLLAAERRKTALANAKARAEGRESTGWTRTLSRIDPVLTGKNRSPFQFKTFGEDLSGQFQRTVGYAASGALLYGSFNVMRETLQSANALQKELMILRTQFREAEKAGADFGDLSFDKLTDQIQDVSVATATAPDKIAELERTLAGAFATNNGTPNYRTTLPGGAHSVEDAMRLSKLTGLPEKEIGDDLVAISIAFHKNFEDIGNDVLDLASKFGASSSEVAAFSAHIAPIASQVGFTGEQIEALGAVMNQAYGGSGSQLADSLFGVFGKISENPQALVDVFASGAATKNMVPQVTKSVTENNMRDLLLELSKAWPKFSGGQQQAIADLVGGRRELPAFYAAIERPQTLNRALGYKGGPEGTMDQYWKDYSKSVEFQLAQVRQEVDKVGQALLKSGLGQTLIAGAEAASLLAKALTTVFRVLAELNDVSKGFVGQMATLAIAVKAISLARGVLANRGTEVMVPIGDTGATERLRGGKAAAFKAAEAAAAQRSGDVAVARSEAAAIATETEARIAVTETDAKANAAQLAEAERVKDRALTKQKLAGIEAEGAARAGAVAEGEVASGVEATRRQRLMRQLQFTGVSPLQAGRGARLAGAGRLGATWAGTRALAGGIGGAAMSGLGLMMIAGGALQVYTQTKQRQDQLREQASQSLSGVVANALQRGDSPSDILERAYSAAGKDSLGDHIRGLVGVKSSGRMATDKVAADLKAGTHKANQEMAGKLRSGLTDKQIADELDATDDPSLRSKYIPYLKYARDQGETDIRNDGLILGKDETLSGITKAAEGGDKEAQKLLENLYKKAGVEGDWRKAIKDHQDKTEEGKQKIADAIDKDSAAAERSLSSVTATFNAGQSSLGELSSATAKSVSVMKGLAERYRKQGLWDKYADELKKIQQARKDLSDAVVKSANDALELRSIVSDVQGGGAEQELRDTKISSYKILRSKDTTSDAKVQAAKAIIAAQKQAFEDWVNSADTEAEKLSRAQQGYQVDPLARAAVIRASLAVVGSKNVARLRRVADAMGKSQGAVATLIADQIMTGTSGELKVFQEELKGQIKFEQAVVKALEQRLKLLPSKDMRSLDAAIKLQGMINDITSDIADKYSTLADISGLESDAADPGATGKLDPDQVKEDQKAAADDARQRALSAIEGQAAVAKAMANGDAVAEAQAELNAARAAYQYADPNDPGAGPQAWARIVSATNALNNAFRQRAINFAEGQAAVAKALADGDPMKEAQADLQLAYVQYANAAPDQKAQTWAQVISARNAIRHAQEQADQAYYSYLQTVYQNNPAAAANAQLQAANAAVSSARGAAARYQALSQQVEAQRAVRKAFFDAIIGQEQLAAAIANSNGDVIEAARRQLEIAKYRLQEGQQNGAQGAVLSQLQAEVINATAQLTQTTINQHLSDLDYLFRTEQITAAQMINLLQQQLQEIPEANKALRQQIMERIYQLRKDMSADLTFDVPSEVRLPTLYEARRLAQTPTGMSYQDNRVIEIKVDGTRSATEIANEVAKVVDSPPTSGYYQSIGMG